MQFARQQSPMLVEEAFERGCKTFVVRRHERQRQTDEASPREVVSGTKHLEMEKTAYLGGRLLRIGRPPNRLGLEVHGEDRTGSGDLHRQPSLAADCVKAIAKAI